MEKTSESWVTLYGTGGSSTQPLSSLSKESLIMMLTGRVRWTWKEDPNK
jgi:hypothetical protein